ncbi:RcnB family protein [Pseudomonas cerasi]
MKKTTLTLIISLFTASSLFSTLSHAEGPGSGPDQQWRQNGGHDNRGDDRRGGDHYDDRGHDDRGHGDRGRGGPDERDHFAWNGHDFRRGHPAPDRFRGDDYRVDDWHDRGLYEPPRGEHWAYVDGNYVLIAAATGVITSIILGNMLGHR